MASVDRSTAGWKYWRKWLPWALGISVLAWTAFRFVPLPAAIAEGYDFLVLPLALKGVYGHRLVLFLAAVIGSAVLIVWPHRLGWPALTTLVGVLFVGWLVVLDMWRNAILTSTIVSAIALYVVLRYLWMPFLQKLPPLARGIFQSLERAVRGHPRFDVYYDAVRAVCWPSEAGTGTTSGIWNRSNKAVASTELGRLGWLFGSPAHWYRCADSTRMLPLWLLFGRRIPGSLRFDWLSHILDGIADEAYCGAANYDAKADEWAKQYLRLITATEAKAECLAFTPEILGKYAEELAEAAVLYDELSRIGLARHLWLASCVDAQAGTIQSDHIQKHMDWVRKCRVTLIRKAWLLRGAYLGFTDAQLSDDVALTAALQVADGHWSGESAAQQCTFVLTYYQLSLLAGEENPALAELSNRLTEAIRDHLVDSPAEERQTAARKAVEVTVDSGRYQAAKDIFGLGWIQQVRDSRDQIDARLEGHIHWRVTRVVDHQDLVIDAYGAATCAFARGGCDEIDALKQEIVSRAQASGEQLGRT